MEDILLQWLREHNHIRFQGQEVPFSESNLQNAIGQLREEPHDGLVHTNENICELLTLGVSLPQTIAGDTRSFNIHFIDWRHSENNVYRVSDEFVVPKGRSEETRPDVVREAY